MTLFLILLVVAAGLLWWIRYRSARLRRDAENREAQVLEALFAARRSAAGNGGETIDLDRVFGAEAAASENPTSTDAVLRAAGLEAELIALVKAKPAPRDESAAALEADESMLPDEGAGQAPGATPVQYGADDSSPVRAGRPAAAPEEAVLVRDLVQIFYEARGYRAVPASRAARPIELVLRHKTDPLRSYAFAPLAEPVSGATAQSMLELARRIDQSRVLIAAEGGVAAELSDSLLAQGIRVLDGAAIESQLAQLDFATAAKIRAVARQRAARRAQTTLG